MLITKKKITNLRTLTQDINMENYGEDTFIDETLEGWIINKCDDWRNNFETNYQSTFDEYFRRKL